MEFKSFTTLRHQVLEVLPSSPLMTRISNADQLANDGAHDFGRQQLTEVQVPNKPAGLVRLEGGNSEKRIGRIPMNVT